MKRVDAVGKKVLIALINEPRASVDQIADSIGATPEAVRARLDKLRDQGVLRGFSVQVSAAELGCPHEILVTGAPTSATTRGALESLCAESGVTRVFTLAHQNAIAFTYCGSDLDDMRRTATGLADRAGLQSAEVTLIVDTLFDDASQGVRRAWETVTA